ncbi:MAG: 30S ribosomal protein S20 [Culicoidibacterales bacterium]
MANIKSQVKRIKTNEKRRLSNQAFKSSMRTAVKNVEKAILANDKDAATTALVLAYKKLDTAATKGIVHPNFAARNKSRLASKVNGL